MQIFPRELNYLPLALALVAGGLGAGVFIVFWVCFTPPNLQVGYTPKQPVQYSHCLHAIAPTESAKEAPVRESRKTDNAISWVRVHQVPDDASSNDGAYLKSLGEGG